MMILTYQQECCLNLVQKFKCLRLDQLLSLMQRELRGTNITEVNEGHLISMLHQLRYGNQDVRVDGNIVHITGVEPNPHFLEAVDVMRELTDTIPWQIQIELEGPVLLRFVLQGEKLRLFAVAWLYLGMPIEYVERRKMERIIWLSEGGGIPEGLELPHRHFFAVRQKDGTHRFYGSNKP